MKVSVLLADKGTPTGRGTLNLLNVGWVQTTLGAPLVVAPGAPPMVLTPPHAVAIFYEVEPHHCNKPIELILELVTQDEQPVAMPGPAGPQPMVIRQTLTVTSPAGRPPGSPGTGNSLVEIFPGLPLTAGTYIWKVSLDGEHSEDWNARFFVVEKKAAKTSFGIPLGGDPPEV